MPLKRRRVFRVNIRWETVDTARNCMAMVTISLSMNGYCFHESAFAIAVLSVLAWGVSRI
jgi:hypothetical protein